MRLLSIQHSVVLFIYWLIFERFFVFCCFFPKATFFRKMLSGISSECQTVWIQVILTKMSCLIWVQTVCKGYQKTTLSIALPAGLDIERSLNDTRNIFSNPYKPSVLFVGHQQTVQNQIRRCIMRLLIRFSTVCSQNFL